MHEASPDERTAALRQACACRPEALRCVVVKSRRLLTLFLDDELLVEIPVIIGRNPYGHKAHEGDLRTPEGEYRICYRNPTSRFHRFLGLDYPNVRDAEAGWGAGLLTEEEYRGLLSAASQGACPNWYTRLGGEVGIHGGGIDRDGTAGCIAMDDAQIELLWDVMPIGTPVEIRP